MKSNTRIIYGGCFSGGASDGGRTVGVLCELKPEYDAVAGNSVGALLLVNTINGDFGMLEHSFSNVENNNIFKSSFIRSDGSVKWLTMPYYITRNLLDKKRVGLLDSSPLHDYIHSTLSESDFKKIGGKPSFVTVHSNTNGETLYIDLSNRSIDFDSCVDWIWASTLVPPIMPSLFKVRPKGDSLEEFVDGGVSDLTPMKPLIEYGCTHIDVFMHYPKPLWYNEWVEDRFKGEGHDILLSNCYQDKDQTKKMSTNFIDSLIKTVSGKFNDSDFESLKNGLVLARDRGVQQVKIYWMSKEHYKTAYYFSKDKMKNLIDIGKREARDESLIDIIDFNNG